MKKNKDGLIVRSAPDHVFAYLDQYTNDNDREVIAYVLSNEIKNVQNLAREIPQRPEFLVTMGADEQATSLALDAHLLQARRSKTPKRYVHTDIGHLIRVLAHADTLLEAKRTGQTHWTTDDVAIARQTPEYIDGPEASERHVRNMTDMLAGKWLYGALYLRDRIIYEALRRGLPVAMQTSGHGQHFPDVLKDVKNFPNPTDRRYVVSGIFVASAFPGKSHKERDISMRGHTLPEHIDGELSMAVRDSQHATHVVTTLNGGLGQRNSKDFNDLSAMFDRFGKGSQVTVRNLTIAYRRKFEEREGYGERTPDELPGYGHLRHG